MINLQIKKAFIPRSASLRNLWDKSCQLLRCHPYCRYITNRPLFHTPTCAFHDNGGIPSAPTCRHGVQAALTSPFGIIHTTVIPPSTALCAYFTKRTCLDQRFLLCCIKSTTRARCCQVENRKYFLYKILTYLTFQTDTLRKKPRFTNILPLGWRGVYTQCVE